MEHNQIDIQKLLTRHILNDVSTKCRKSFNILQYKNYFTDKFNTLGNNIISLNLLPKSM